MSDKLLLKYYMRLKTEGLLKSFLWGGAIGFGTLAIFGMVHWIMGWKFAWVGWLIWAVFSIGSTLIFYQVKYKPTTKYIARRIDDLGLHERILTMTELEGDDSYIARRQREDALKALSSVRIELLTIGVSATALITAGVSMVLGVFGFLFAVGVFKDFADLNPVIPTSYTITYGVLDGEGTISGKAEQTVNAGEKTETVVAVPADGWRFLKWSDETGVPYRSDEVNGEKTYLAVFVEMNFGEINGLPDDTPPDAPGNGEGNESQNSQDNNQNDDTPPQDKYEEVNQIIDGGTYYGDVYDEMYKEALDKLGDDKYTDDQKEIGNGYFDNIEQGKKDDDEENN